MAKKKKTSNKTKKVNEEKDLAQEVLEKEEIKEDKKEDKKEKKKESKIVVDKTKAKQERKEKMLTGLNKVDEHRYVIYSFIAGALLVTLIAFIIWPERIATLADGTQPVATIDGTTFTADDLYNQMKETYSVANFVDTIDAAILEEKYEETEEMLQECEETAEQYISYYVSTGYYTEESFLAANGFTSREDFIDYLKLDYRRKLYYEDYLESQITDEEIQEYYDSEVFGDINTQHILVSTSGDLSEEEAKALAEEIIGKLNDGASFDEVKEEYADSTTYENLGYVAYNASLETAFLDALKEMSENSYSTEPVETTYGYHVIYRGDQKEKASLDDLRDSIIESISDEMTEEDPQLYYQVLIDMRKEANLEFADTQIGSKYDEYCDSLLTSE